MTAKAIDYSLSNWRELTRYLDDAQVPIDNNAAENAVRPLAVGRNKAKSAFMRSHRWLRVPTHSAAGVTRSRSTSHSHSDRRNSKSALGGRYRAGLTSGCFKRASARSFMARSASTYICVVDGLS